MDKYGSPNLDDATAEWDQMIDNAGKWVKDMMREVVPQVINRPIGFVPVKPEDQLADFQRVYQNPAALAQIHAQRMQQMGQDKGTQDFIKWYKRNLKRIK